MSMVIVSDLDPVPYGPTGYLGKGVGLGLGAAELVDITPIPRSEWADRIDTLNRAQAQVRDYLRRAGWKVHNQAQTNYCWVFAAAAAVEGAMILQQQKWERLSPASVGAKITGFRNVGGWSSRAIEYIAQHGIVPARLWPPTAIERKYDTTEAWKAAEEYRVASWYDLPPSLDSVATCLLLGVPVAVGYNWWGHAVLAVGLIRQGATWGLVIANSWGESWSENGYGILLGRRAIPDDAAVPTSITP